MNLGDMIPLTRNVKVYITDGTHVEGRVSWTTINPNGVSFDIPLAIKVESKDRDTIIPWHSIAGIVDEKTDEPS